jgi:hypothetical protein
MPVINGVAENWCLVSQSTTSYGKDATDGSANDWVPNYGGQLMQVSETWLLDGDAIVSRK